MVLDPMQVLVAGRTVTLEPGATFTIGRAADSSLTIDHPAVSRHHVAIRHDGSTGRWVLVDTGSSLGTWCDGRRVVELPLDPGVEVRLGDPDVGPVFSVPNGQDQAGSSGDGNDDRSGAGRLVGLHQPGAHPELVIGRDPDCDIVVDDLTVSRRHARLRVDPEGDVWIDDLRSSNGTILNGRRITSARLESLDVIVVGDHLFRLVDGELEEYVEDATVGLRAVGLTVVTPEGVMLLDSVSFRVGGSSLTGVVGPSGAGKSTLLGALTGDRPATAGRLWYGDRDAATDRAALRSRIGLVPQDDVLHHALTVEQELRHAATLRFAGDTTEAELARRVDEVIAELDLAEVRHLRIDRLSGGQRKRVSVGIELLTRPALLFLDEPTSGLDPGYERALMQLLRRLADGGRVVVVITHAVASIRLCDRLLMLAPGGRTAFFGPAQFAPEYFGTGDLEEVFHLLSEHDEIDWAGRYRASSFHERYVGDVGPGAPAVPMRVAPLPHDRLRQFRTLLRRNRQVLTADRRNLITLLAQGPVLGLVLLVALPPGELDAPALFELRVASRSSLVLLLIVLGATWLGSIVAVRSIADEAVILRREHAAGLSLGAYIGAKAVVLGSVTVAAVVPMAVVATLRQGGPDGAAVLGLPTLELVVAVALTALAAMAQAMLLSAVVPTGDRAMSLLPALLILQMVLAVGAVFPEVTDGPGLDQLTVLSSAYWGMAAVGATADLNALQGLTVALSELPPLDLLAPEATLEAIIATIGAAAAAGDPRFEPRAEVWLANAGASVAIGAVALVLAHVSLRRRLAR